MRRDLMACDRTEDAANHRTGLAVASTVDVGDHAAVIAIAVTSVARVVVAARRIAGTGGTAGGERKPDRECGGTQDLKWIGADIHVHGSRPGRERVEAGCPRLG